MDLHLLTKLKSATRQKIGMLVEQWTRLCTLVERVLKRREAAAVRLFHSLRRICRLSLIFN